MRVHGVRGAVAVAPLTDSAERFFDLDQVVLEGAVAREATIASVEITQKLLIVRFAGIESRDEATNLVGSFISIPRARLTELPEHKYFQFEIMGMSVESESGEVLGQIVQVLEMPANDIWRVEGRYNFLLPAVRAFILGVDRDRRVVTIRPINGLLGEPQ